jgi:hypothetical protein
MGVDLSKWLMACEVCGKSVDFAEIINEDWKVHLADCKKCVECAYWDEIMDNRPEHEQVIRGYLYDFPNTPNPRSTTARYIYTNSGDVMSSYRAVCYGKIPDRLREHFPDTARFITKEQYQIMVNNEDYSCRSKGCWDRTHCFWYKLKEMDWNKIPASHKIGDEHCPTFINKYSF